MVGGDGFEDPKEQAHLEGTVVRDRNMMLPAALGGNLNVGAGLA